MSYLVSSHNVLNYTAVAAARSASVGLNDFMLQKVSRYISIPVAGPNNTPNNFGARRPGGRTMGLKWDNAISSNNTPGSALGDFEVSVRTYYHMAAVDYVDLILDYDNWESEATDIHGNIERDSDGLITFKIKQTVPITLPFSRVFFGHLGSVEAVRGGHVATYPSAHIKATSIIEDHAKFYLQDGFSHGPDDIF